MLYLASYDIAEQDADEYQQLWDYSDSLGSAKLLYSQYAVPFTGTALELATKIQAHLKKADRLLVCEIFNSNTATSWINLKITTAAFGAMLVKYARTLKVTDRPQLNILLRC
jgi:hypothetical protein